MKTNDIDLERYRGYSTFKISKKFGDWRIINQDKNTIFKIYMSDLRPLLNNQNLKIVNFKDIAYKGFNASKNKTHENCICCKGKRYSEIKNYKLIYPPILIKGKTYNVFNKKYRAIDGKHRIWRLIEMKKNQYPFFVLSYNDIKPYLITIKNE